jgi:hypothetical protein
MNGHLHIRGLDIAVDDALLMSVLDGFANLQEQTKSLFNGKFLKVTVFGDWDAFDIFHYKVWSADLGGSSIKHMRNVGVFQQGQSLPFGLKASNYLLGIHARLDDFQRDPVCIDQSYRLVQLFQHRDSLWGQIPLAPGDYHLSRLHRSSAFLTANVLWHTLRQ